MHDDGRESYCAATNPCAFDEGKISSGLREALTSLFRNHTVDAASAQTNLVGRVDDCIAPELYDVASAHVKFFIIPK